MRTPRWSIALCCLSAVAALAAAPPHLDASDAAPRGGTARTLRDSGAPPAYVSARDERTGQPTMLRALSDPDARPPRSFEDAARYWLARHAARYGLSDAALATAQRVLVHDLGRGGVIVVLRQVVDGVELFHRDVKVLLDRDRRLVAIGGNLHPDAVPSAKHGSFRLTPETALATALDDLFGLGVSAEQLVSSPSAGGWRSLSWAGSRGEPGLSFVAAPRARPVYFAFPDRLASAWQLEVLARRGSDAEPTAYSYVVGADDGAVLYRENLTHHTAFNYRVYADSTGDFRPADGPIADFTPHPTGTPNGTYPAYVAPALISIDGFDATHDPWLAASATVTSGNNIAAYTDDLNPEGLSAGDVQPTTSSALTFDYSYDTTLGPQANTTQKMASVTDLFYVTNWLHDWWYDSGFDEAAGNAQQDNLGRGGIAGDALQAEAQAGAPTQRNNSNMVVPGDGTSPRMHMFVWDGPHSASLSVNGTSYTVNVASFGPQTFTTSANLVVANDGSGTVTDACQPLTNTVTGEIVIADRGTCSFERKVLNAQSAGAVGVLIVDNVTAATPPPLFDDPTITTGPTIGALSVTKADGATLEALVAAGTTSATMTRTVAVDLDGTIDNTVVAHEWGHYLHLRQVACGDQQCLAMSEGWGDFNALLMMLRQGDSVTGTYPIAMYAAQAVSSDPAYYGLRRFPYSGDMTKNPLTFKDISDGQALPTTAPINAMATGYPNSEVHGAGEIWTSMLFDGYLALVKQSLLSSPRYTFAEAHRRMTDYVEGALKLAPTDPTYLEQRDALLAVASAADPADEALLAAAFAGRGAGTCAVGPPRTSTDFTGITEDYSVAALLQLESASLDDSVSSCDHDGVLDSGETGVLTLVLANTGGASWQGSVAVSSTSAGVSFPNGATATFGAIAPGQRGTATVRVALDPSVTGKQLLAFHLLPNPVATCTGTGTFDTTAAADFDVVPASSLVDDVEAPVSTWTVTGTNGNKVWSIEETAPGQHVWAGIDYSSPSDTQLVSPPLQVASSGSFTFSFDAAFLFESTMGVNWDGEVIEVSHDSGATWQDISMYSMVPSVFATIGDPSGQATNALRNRVGFVGQNASYPAADHFSFDLGTALAGQTVQVRFRNGSDDTTGNLGIQLDNIAFTGLTAPPFPSVVADMTACAPMPDAGMDAGVDAGVDAGADAGAPDAGVPDAGVDAGVDAGAPDAGGPDASVPDAGGTGGGAGGGGGSSTGGGSASGGGVATGGGSATGGGGHKASGCGCNEGGGAAPALLLLLGLAAFRRRVGWSRRVSARPDTRKT